MKDAHGHSFGRERLAAALLEYAWEDPASVMVTLSSDYQAVLESDEIRILPKDEAIKFWRVWWSEQKKKEK